LYFISALLGYATTVIPHWFTHYVASGLFAVFGLKMLKEGQCVSHVLCTGWAIKKRPQSVQVKNFLNRSIIGEDMDKSKVPRFLWPTVRILLVFTYCFKSI